MSWSAWVIACCPFLTSLPCLHGYPSRRRVPYTSQSDSWLHRAGFAPTRLLTNRVTLGLRARRGSPRLRESTVGSRGGPPARRLSLPQLGPAESPFTHFTKAGDIRGHNVGHPQLGIRADGPILPHKTITRIAPGHLPQVSDIPRCDRLGVLVLDDLLLLP
jgi:hypothetical protein